VPGIASELRSLRGGNLGLDRSKLAVAVGAVFLGAFVGTSLASTTTKPSTPTQGHKVSGSKTHHSSGARRKSAVAHSRKAKGSKKTAKNWRRRGQQKIDAQRTREIQEALIRQHYLDGKASGAWDQQTQTALKRYQADNGWQSKTVPDARALIKLGLGPDHEHLLNPESAMTSQPITSPAAQSPAENSSTPVTSGSDRPQN